MALVTLVCPSLASAQVAWSPMAFSNGATNQTVKLGKGETVSGTIAVSNPEACSGRYWSITMYEYVGQGDNQFLHSSSSAYNFILPGTREIPVRFTVAPGPSRTLRFGSQATPEAGCGLFIASSYDSLLGTLVRPKLRVDRNDVRNRDRVTFSGTVPGPYPFGRPAVALQARSGKKWRTFKAVPVNSEGGYSVLYRFTQTTRRQRYRFRAKVIAEPGTYPYVTAPSKTKGVLVRP